jgi:hypothetical protein
MSLISLGTHLADPAQRLAHVMSASASMKSTVGSMKSVLPTDFPSLGVPWLMQSLTALYGRAHVAERVPALANLVISNVPGPTVPLYMAGAKMLTNYPTSIVVHGIALNITVQTYNESLDVGIIACAQAMPEVGEFAAHIETSFIEFQALPANAPAAAPAPPKKTVKAPAKKGAKVATKPATKATPKTPAKAAKATARSRASAPSARRVSR